MKRISLFFILTFFFCAVTFAEEIDFKPLVHINAEMIIEPIKRIVADLWRQHGMLFVALIGTMLIMNYAQGVIEGKIMHRERELKRRQMIEREVAKLEVRAEAKRIFEERREASDNIEVRPHGDAVPENDGESSMAWHSGEENMRSGTWIEEEERWNRFVDPDPIHDPVWHLDHEERIDDIVREEIEVERHDYSEPPLVWMTYRESVLPPPRRRERYCRGMESDDGGGY